MVVLCNIMARVISATMNYFINRKYVFCSKRKGWKPALKYTCLAISILTFNSAVLFTFTKFLHLSPYVSKIIVEIVAFVISFLVQQRKIF